MGVEWPPLMAGMFGGAVEAFNTAAASVIARVEEAGWR